MSNERDSRALQRRSISDLADQHPTGSTASPNLGVGPSVADLPFPYPVSDHHRIANALWLLDNNLSGRALLPAETDEADAPRFGAVAAPDTSGVVTDRILSRLEWEGRGDLDANVAAPQSDRNLLAQGEPFGPAVGQGQVANPSVSPGRTKVSLVYRPIHGTTIMHSYVVAEGDGERFYVGAFPEQDLGFASNVGQAAVDAMGARSDSRGRLVPQTGAFDARIGNDYNIRPSIRVDFDLDKEFTLVKRQLEDYADAIRKAEFPYGGARTNSNSFSHGAVRTLGLVPRPVPSVLAPGANSPLMLSERR